MGLRTSAAALAASIAVAASASAAEPEPGAWNVSPYAGIYLPDRDVVDDAATYGIRIGRPFAEHFVASASFGFTNLDGRSSHGGVTKDANLDQTIVDAEIGYVVDPGRRITLATAVGVGWAFLDGKTKISDVEGPFRRSKEDDGLTASASIGPLVKLTDRISLRLMSRWRWFEARKDDEIDQEVFAGIVFGLGGSR